MNAPLKLSLTFDLSGKNNVFEYTCSNVVVFGGDVTLHIMFGGSERFLKAAFLEVPSIKWRKPWISVVTLVKKIKQK